MFGVWYAVFAVCAQTGVCLPAGRGFGTSSCSVVGVGALSLGLGLEGLMSGVCGLGFGVQCLVFTGWGLMYRVWGLEFSA